MKSAVVIIGDLNYLIPSAATALSARQNLANTSIEVLLFIVIKENPDENKIIHAAHLLSQQGVRVTPVKISQLSKMSGLHIDRAVPVSALSRLWLDDFLEKDIDRFLYLDGDILVDGALDPVFSLEIPRGGFLAAEDCLCMFEHEMRQPHKYWRPYIESIGVPWSSYFNTGVLLVDRSGWKQISNDALQFILEKPDLCKSSDQTALNVVAGSRRGFLPLKWNYQTEHMMVLDPRTIQRPPVIWHFTAGPKPWECAEWPWDESFNRAYRLSETLLSEADILTPNINDLMFEEGLRHRRRQRNLQRWRFLFRKFRRAWHVRKAL